MTPRLVPDSEIVRVIKLAREEGLDIAGLDVGRDYVRLIPPAKGGDSVEGYIGPVRNQKAARNGAR